MVRVLMQEEKGFKNARGYMSVSNVRVITYNAVFAFTNSP
jgi:hypothetical protein